MPRFCPSSALIPPLILAHTRSRSLARCTQMRLPTSASPCLPHYGTRPAAFVLGPPSHFHARTSLPSRNPAHFDDMPYRLAAHRACLPAIRAAGRPLRARRCTASGSVIVPCPCHDAHADADVVVPHAHSPARRTEDRGSCPSHLTSARRRDTSSYRRPAAIPAERTASVARTIPARRADGRDRTSLGAAHVDAVETRVRRAPSARGADTAQAVSGSISRPHSLETPTCAPAPPCVLAGPHAASHRL